MRSTIRLTILSAAALVTAACAPREWIMPALGMNPPVFRDFGEGFVPPISNETGQPINGFGGNGGGVRRTPLILVHGTTVSASFWKGARAHYLAQGYTGDELWAVGYGWNNGRYFDSNELSAVTLDRFVSSVTDYLSKKSGRPIRQVDMIGHSLGNTIVRHWVKQTNSWHILRSFIGNSGVNHGSWTLTGDPRGPNRTAAFELYVKSPWLAALNRGGETPGPTRYMTLYDGTGLGDLFYPPPFEHSPRLDGAHNVPYNVEHSGILGHLELATRPGPLDTMLAWLREADEALPQALPPEITRDATLLKANQPEARLYCAGGLDRSALDYPTLQSPAVEQVDLSDGLLHTCFAHNSRTHWSSPMARFKVADAAPSDQPLTISAIPPAGVFEQPQAVTLIASDPKAFIVYSTVAAEVNSGMPLYSVPVYVAAPLTLTAVAYAPDGRVSQPVRLKYDISLEYVEAVNTPERQFDPSVPVEHKGHRKVGR